MKTFEEYHEYIKSTVLPQFPNFGDSLHYPTIGQAGENGEMVERLMGIIALALLTMGSTVASGKIDEAIKKLWRDHNITAARQFNDAFISNESLELRDKVIKEIGDQLWYLDALAHTLGSSLEECAQLNVAKLTGRAQRGTSLGSGDNR